MLIAKEYGYDTSLSNIVGNNSNTHSDILKDSKSKPSEFDMLLSFFQNSSAARADSSDSSNIIDFKPSDFAPQHETTRKTDSDVVQDIPKDVSADSTTEIPTQEDFKKEDSAVEKKSPLDVRYVSEINKKVNALLDKMQKTKYPSEEQTRVIASELHSLILQLQKFAENVKTSEGIHSSLNGAQTPRDQLLAQLLQRMGHKLELAQGFLKNMELTSKSLASQVVSTQRGVELRLSELKQVDGELTKTLSLLSDLKKIAQEGQSLLQNSLNPNKTAHDTFVSVNFTPELSQSKQRNVHKTDSSKIGMSVVAQKLESMSSTSSHPSFSGFQQGGSSSEGQSSYSNGGWNMVGASGGLGAPHSGLWDSSSLTDASRMSFREKVFLGQEILQQMGKEMKGSIGKHESHFSISLKPEELGEVKIIVDMKDGVIKSQIVVQNELVKDILKTRFEDVKELFTQNGVDVSEFGVHTEAEFQEQSRSSREAIEGLFQTQKHLTGQTKLHRYMMGDGGLQSAWVYDKIDDTQKEWNNFTIVI